MAKKGIKIEDTTSKKPKLLYDPSTIRESMEALNKRSWTPQVRAPPPLSHLRDAKPKRSALSAGKRPAMSKTVSWNAHDEL